MKLPSISHVANDARGAFMRFPLVILNAITGTMCALILFDYEGPSQASVLIRIVLGALLAFPLLSGLALTAEKRRWGTPASLGMQIAGAILIGLYATSIPQNLDGAPLIHLYRFFALFTGTILFAFVAPYIGHENELGYWNYCKTICLRIVTTGLYAVVLFAGLAIAFAALDNLFGVHVPPKRYGELWVFIIGIFSTWFLLAGIPKDLERLDSMTEYPKGLKIFSQYILFPLVLLYMVILYAYLGKILVAWDWPQGWVSRLILGFMATGFASLLLLHPIKDRIENVWIKTASRWFYAVIIPLTVMLFLAVWQRISVYGFTEGRYLGVATVVWLCVVTPYFIFSRKKKIILLTASLCVAVCAASFGPWGMFAVSERSQVNRLTDILTSNQMLVDGRVQAAPDSLRIETVREISSILGYLSEVHGFDAIQPWFAESLKQDTVGTGEAYKDPALVAKLMGVTFIRQGHVGPPGTMYLSVNQDLAFDIEGYDRLLRGQRVHAGVTVREFPAQGIAYRMGGDLGTMTVTVSRDTIAVDSLQVDLMPLVGRLTAEYANAATDKIPPEKMTIVAAGRTAKIKVLFTTTRTRQNQGATEIESFEAVIAYK